MKNPSILRVAVMALAACAVAAAPNPASAQTSLVAPLGSSFTQAANGSIGSPTLGDVDWINSILQQNNSTYYEGMSSPQRLIFTNIPNTADNKHILLMSHQATKGGTHAYDYVTSWDNAIAAAAAIDPGHTLFIDLNGEACDPALGSQVSTQLCNDLHNPGAGGIETLSNMVGNLGTILGDNVQASANAYEVLFGVRRPSFFSFVPLVGSPTITFLGYDNPAADTAYALYKIEWQYASAPTNDHDRTIGIEMAGHLALGDDPAATGIGYGAGKGSSFINGGPYHFKLDTLDGASLGAQDNQIKGADILIPPPTGCQIPLDQTVCTGASNFNLTDTSAFQAGVTYTWSFQNIVGANPSFCSATDTQTVCVTPGTQVGSFDVRLTKSNASGSTFCQTHVTVNAPATVSDVPNETRCVGASVTFCTTVGGTAPISIQWKKNGVDIAGATNSCLTISSPTAADAATYTVTATNACGNASDTATLTVNAPPTVDAIGDATRCTGASVQFCANNVTGTPPISFQWKKNGAPIAGATNSCYTIASVQLGDAGTYSVDVSNVCATVTSGAGTLTVNQGPTVGPVGNETRCTGTSVQFCANNVTGTPPISFQWKKNGVNIPGATNSCFTIPSVQTGDAGAYSVQVLNSCGDATSGAGTLTVNVGAGVGPVGNQSACVGASVEFCASNVTGTPPISFQWKKNGVNIPGATNSCYSIPSAQTADAGSYSVMVSNVCASATSGAGTLTLNNGPTVDAVGPQTKCVGEPVAFCATNVTGTPPISFQWKKNGVNIPGATNSCYSIPSVQTGDAADYSVNVANSCGNQTSGAGHLTVNTAPTVAAVGNETRCTGTSVTFCATNVTGTPPISFQWKKNGVNIGGATNSCLTIPSVQTGDAGSYTVTVSNSCGDATSGPGTLTVNTSPTVAPIGNETRCTGQSVTFCASASGTPVLSFQWKKNGVDIAGATNSCFTIPSVGSGDAGSYTVLVSNLCGNATGGPATLTINQDTSTTPFEDQDACPGDTITFCTTASGTGPHSFQWKHNSVPIAGATGNCFTIPAFMPMDSGEYCVDVSGACNTVTECAELTGNKCGEFCSLTQGAYGNAGGHYNGVQRPELIYALLATDLVVGKLGQRSLTITQDDVDCVLLRLPGGGPAAALPSGFGNGTFNSSCQTVPVALPLQNGKIKNILLAQTITLGLNIRLNQTQIGDCPNTMGMDLGAFDLCQTITTVGVEPGPDGCIGTIDDIASGDPQSFTIPASVLTALTTLGLPLTVDGLFELANRALAGQANLGGASLSAISGAADAINNAFDECRVVNDCSNP